MLPGSLPGRSPGVALLSGITTVPVLLVRDGNGPQTAPASRSCLCNTAPVHCFRLRARCAPTRATPCGPSPPPRNHALLRGCRQHPENLLWPKGDVAVTKLGTINSRWLHVQLPWTTTQTLPRAESTGMGLDGEREGPAPSSLGARRGDTACAVLSPECATTSKGSRAPQAAPSPTTAVPAGTFLLKTPQNF